MFLMVSIFLLKSIKNFGEQKSISQSLKQKYLVCVHIYFMEKITYYQINLFSLNILSIYMFDVT